MSDSLCSMRLVNDQPSGTVGRVSGMEASL
jgi:hypothetical protein